MSPDSDTGCRLITLEVWLGYRTVVDSEHALNHICQVGWYRQGPSPSAVGTTVVFKVFNCRSKCFGESGRRARQENATPRRTGFHHDQIVLAREGLNFCQVSWIGTMFGCVPIM